MTRKKSASNPKAPAAPVTPATPTQSDNKKKGKGQRPAREITFPVVGIGASAGGLEAFSQVLRALPPDTGMAFVLVQHLAPLHESILPTLLAKETAMKVSEIVDGMPVEADHVYVIPPNVNLAILHGVLHLMPRSELRGQHLAVDYFFRSLAEDMGSRAIGVILSGTASDGVMGMKAIKAEGGITFAQDDKSAKYNGMPHNAVAAGCVDFVMPPEAMASELARIAQHPYLARPKSAMTAELPVAEEDDIHKIFILLRRQSGVDFTYYKQATIQRRIKRRMLLHKLDRLPEYIRYLQESPTEAEALYNDILINVTSFFRDPDAFAALAAKVFPEITSGKSADTPVRIWVPGCSTGEEAYSIAISLLEFMGEAASGIPVQIFATDVDEAAINKARLGIYPEGIIDDVSPDRLRRFFARTDAGYQISKQIRDLCVFSRQNVIKDPPFSRLDLISCRNLLIYLERVLQKKVFSVAHYALKPSGFMLLGSAESIGEFANLFQLVDQKTKIYSKKSIASPIHFDFAAPAFPLPEQALQSSRDMQPITWTNLDVQREADRLMMKRYAPPGVVINEQMEILQFRGRTGPYLEPASGEASLNLLKMAREELMLSIRELVARATAEDTMVRKEGIHLTRDGQYRLLNIEVVPLRNPAGAGRCFLVIFEEAEASGPRHAQEPADKARPEDADRENEQLRQELTATREYLQSVIEQQEAGNEELRSANEEIQSSNEELQSINEELETAKEELQSVNEELATVNDELESRNAELTQLNNDLNNLIRSVNLPVIIVGNDMRIRRFSPLAEKALNLIPGDVGRPISDIRPTIETPDMKKLIQEVIDTVRAREVECQDGEGHWYSVRIHPYKTLDNRIDGAVIAFIDIDNMKRACEVARESRDFADAVIVAMRHPILVLDKDLRVTSANAAYLDMFGVSARETVGNLLYHLGNGQWGVPRLRALLDDAIINGKSFDDFIVSHDFEQLGRKTMLISGRHVPRGINRPAQVLMQIECGMEGAHE